MVEPKTTDQEIDEVLDELENDTETEDDDDTEDVEDEEDTPDDA